MIASAVIWVIAINSASQLDKDIVVCDLHKDSTKFPFRKTIPLDVLLLVVLHPPQLLSQKHSTVKDEEFSGENSFSNQWSSNREPMSQFDKKIPTSMLPFK